MSNMKNLVSMPSTKPQQFFYTDFSIVSPADHPKHCLNKILSYIRNILNLRLFLTFRDIQQIYNDQPLFFNQTLNVYSAEELWKKSNNSNAETLDERQMISFLTKIVISLTKQKNYCAQNKNFDRFAELKNTIEWLEERLVQVQILIRDKIKQATIKKRAQLQSKRQSEFGQEIESIRHQLVSNFDDFNKKLGHRHRKQRRQRETNIQQRVQKEAYVFKPSKKLALAKDQSLLAKLAPYKSEKKRPYQCKTLQQQLESITEADKQRQAKKIEEFREVERDKLKRRHVLQREVYLSKLQEKNNWTLAQLQMKKNELNKSEKIKMQKLIEQNNKITNERIQSLKKSLNSYSMRDQSRQIRQIMKQHRQTIQFVNNVEDVGDTVKHSKLDSSNKYTTIDISSQWTKQKKLKRYSDERMETKILRRIKNQSLVDRYDDNNSILRRNSLVNLYDENLVKI